MSATGSLGRQWDVKHEQRPGGGTVHAYDSSGMPVGQMHYKTDAHPHGTTIGKVDVDPRVRRQGVASRMYDEVHQTTQQPFIHYADQMSADGRKSARAMGVRQPERHRMASWTTNGNPTSRKMR